VPNTLEVNLTRWFSLVGNLEPFIESSLSAHGGHFHHRGSNCLVLCHILIEYLDVEVISDILDIDGELLVPHRGLSSVLLDLGLEFLLSVLDTRKRVHLSKELGVSGKTCLNNGKLESAVGCLLCLHLTILFSNY